MVLVLVLCLVAAFAAIGGLAATGLALAPPHLGGIGGVGAVALIAAPVFGLVSLGTGVGAAVLVLRRQAGSG